MEGPKKNDLLIRKHFSGTLPTNINSYMYILYTSLFIYSKTTSSLATFRQPFEPSWVQGAPKMHQEDASTNQVETGWCYGSDLGGGQVIEIPRKNIHCKIKYVRRLDTRSKKTHKK